MAGINSEDEVYDVFHPTPASLKDLSAMAVSLGIWRCEVIKRRTSDHTFASFNPEKDYISSKTVLPDLPSLIHSTIDKYIIKFGLSMRHWLRRHRHHHERVFHFHYSHQNCVLGCFEDFVCDYNGTIHYVRTAERMMRCDQFDVQQKFIIACMYFFEDDIRRLWPFVSSNMDLKSIYFFDTPQLYYWICYLKNELDKIQLIPWDNHVEEAMLDESMTHNRPSVEYFWNRIPTESRMRKARYLFRCDLTSFARYILPNLDDQHLDQMVNIDQGGFEIMRALYLHRNGWYDEEFILSVWMRIQNIINECVFTNEIIAILKYENDETYTMPYYYDPECECQHENDSDAYNRQNWLNLCCEIWNRAPERLKRSAIREISSNNRFNVDLRSYAIYPNTKEYAFFTTFLSYATYDERRTFWSKYWTMLIKSTRCRDFQKTMNMCFENEDEITEFKENVRANIIDVRSQCSRLLYPWNFSPRSFDDLNDWASFIFSEVQAARNFKQELLQEHLTVRSHQYFLLWIQYAKEFSQFIDDAYANAELSANFKHQLMSTRSTQDCFWEYASLMSLEELVQWMSFDAFGLAEGTLQLIKGHMKHALKRRASVNESVLSESLFVSLLSWCLGSDEEVEKFKKKYQTVYQQESSKKARKI